MAAMILPVRLFSVLSITFMLFAVLGGCAPMQTYQERCSNYGFVPGTDAFANCIQQEDNNHRAGAAAALRSIQFAPLPPPKPIQFTPIQPLPVQPPLPPPYPIQRAPQVNCTTTYIGNQAFTNCQ